MIAVKAAGISTRRETIRHGLWHERVWSVPGSGTHRPRTSSRLPAARESSIGEDDSAFGKLVALPRAPPRRVCFGIDRRKLDLVRIKGWIGCQNTLRRKVSHDGGGDVMDGNA